MDVYFEIGPNDTYICTICKDRPVVGQGRRSWAKHEENKKHKVNVARVRYYSSGNNNTSATPAIATAPTVQPTVVNDTNGNSQKAEQKEKPEDIILVRPSLKRSREEDDDGGDEVREKSIKDLETDNPWVLLNDGTNNNNNDNASESGQITINVSKEEGELSPKEVTWQSHDLLPDWVPTDRKYDREFADMIHQEIIDFVTYVSPTKKDHNAREFLVGRFRDAIHRLWGHPSGKKHGRQWADLISFGSFKTMTYLPDGDIDLTVITNRTGSESALLEEIRDMILDRNFCKKKNLHILHHARVPIIKFTESRGECDIDLSVNKNSGLESGEIIQTFLQHKRLGPVLKHLIFLLKHLLHQNGLDEPFTGGIGSYGLALMIIFYLQTNDVVNDKENEDLMDFVHILFLGWLEYFGVEFDYVKYSIVVDKDPERQPSLVTRHNNIDFTLSVMDPQDPKNDVTKNSYKIRLIRNTFASAHQSLMGVYTEFATSESTATTTSLPKSILCSIFSDPQRYRRARTKIDDMDAILYHKERPLEFLPNKKQMVELCRKTTEELEQEENVFCPPYSKQRPQQHQQQRWRPNTGYSSMSSSSSNRPFTPKHPRYI